MIISFLLFGSLPSTSLTDRFSRADVVNPLMKAYGLYSFCEFSNLVYPKSLVIKIFSIHRLFLNVSISVTGTL